MNRMNINKNLSLAFRSGFGFIELVLAITILSIVSIPIFYFLNKSMKDIVILKKSSNAQEEFRRITSEIRRNLLKGNEPVLITDDRITFICDIVENPSYNINGDFDGDGIINIKDADDDSDIEQFLIALPADKWKRGYDLSDDDDNNNNKIDVVVSIYKDGLKLIKASSYDKAYWSGDVIVIPEYDEIVTISDNINAFNVECFGSKNEILGNAIDLNNDGLITEYEIDWAQPPQGYGDRTGSIDTKIELKYVVILKFALGIDMNHDGKSNFRANTEVFPQLFVLKRELL
ncbi:MAG: hypothetical protein ABII27_08905 [bacterium]